eukprot:1503479-Prymnesium_polylepis.1
MKVRQDLLRSPPKALRPRRPVTRCAGRAKSADRIATVPRTTIGDPERTARTTPVCCMATCTFFKCLWLAPCGA